MQQPASRIWTLLARKLNDEISAAEERELSLLLRLHPDEHYAAEIITEGWKNQKAKPNPDLGISFEKLLSTIQKNEMEEVRSSQTIFPAKLITANHIRRLLLYTAVAACLVAGAFWLQRSLGSIPAKATRLSVNEISTRYGSRTKLLLPDSTQVWLNAGSTLTYNNSFGKTTREINLKGEAYFDVVRNEEKPFIIHTDKIDIKVLGTAFNVKSYPGEKKTETSLIRGSLEVTIRNRQQGKIVLKPNEKLVISNTEEHAQPTNSVKGPKTVANTDTEPEALVAIRTVSYDEEKENIIETAWVQNKLIFNRQTFEELAVDMERWFGVSIRFNDRSLLHNRLTGTFEKESIQQALEALQYTTRFRYLVNKNVITIFK